MKKFVKKLNKEKRVFFEGRCKPCEEGRKILYGSEIITKIYNSLPPKEELINSEEWRQLSGDDSVKNICIFHLSDRVGGGFCAKFTNFTNGGFYVANPANYIDYCFDNSWDGIRKFMNEVVGTYYYSKSLVLKAIRESFDYNNRTIDVSGCHIEENLFSYGYVSSVPTRTDKYNFVINSKLKNVMTGGRMEIHFSNDSGNPCRNGNNMINCFNFHYTRFNSVNDLIVKD